MPSLLITGITSGIGAVVLQRALDEDFKVTGVVREADQKELLQKQYPNLELLVADLSQPAQVETLIQQIKDRTFDYLLFNAGTGHFGQFADLPPETINTVTQTNLLSYMHLTHALLPKAREHGSKFVYVSSLSAHLPSKYFSSYAATKAGLSQFSHSLSTEEPQVKFLCIEIGPTKTEIHRKAGYTGSMNRRWQSKETIGNRIFTAMQTKTGCTTITLEWWLLRKITRTFDSTIRKLVTRTLHAK